MPSPSKETGERRGVTGTERKEGGKEGRGNGGGGGGRERENSDSECFIVEGHLTHYKWYDYKHAPTTYTKQLTNNTK